MPSSTAALTALHRRIWNGSLPLEIRLAPADCRTYTDSESYYVHYPRLSYLAFLLPRLHAFFSPRLIDPDIPAKEAWLEFDTVPLKWHWPTGLLYDILSGAKPVDLPTGMEHEKATGEGSKGSQPLPWRVTLHYSDYPRDQLIDQDVEHKALHDNFINAVKEADFVRNGNGRTVMGMSKEDSDNLWLSVKTHDLDLFNSVNNKLVYPRGVTLRHVPIKVYLPTSASQGTSETITEEQTDEDTGAVTGKGHVRVVQSLIPLQLPSGQPQTLGTGLHAVLPTIFPSRRMFVYAHAVLHGTVAPLSASLEELGRAASYGDGFLHVVVIMFG